MSIVTAPPNAAAMVVFTADRPAKTPLPPDNDVEATQLKPYQQNHMMYVPRVVSVEPPDARADSDAREKRREAAGDVHDRAPGVVHDPGGEQEAVGLRPHRGRPPIVAPRPVRDHGVDETGDARAVDGVRFESEPLRDGAGDDRGRRRRERERVHELGVVHASERFRVVGAVAAVERAGLQRERGAADEGRVPSVEKRVPDEVEAHGGERDVHEVLEQDVLRVADGDCGLVFVAVGGGGGETKSETTSEILSGKLRRSRGCGRRARREARRTRVRGRTASDLEQGEPRLHEKHEGGAVDDEHRVLSRERGARRGRRQRQGGRGGTGIGRVRRNLCEVRRGERDRAAARASRGIWHEEAGIRAPARHRTSSRPSRRSARVLTSARAADPPGC
eukprot:31144-Pelagococcus_subviridis.AAC.7